MKRLLAPFHLFYLSIFKPDVYRFFIKQNLKRSLVYFIFWMYLFSLILGIFIAVVQTPKLKKDFDTISQTIHQNYPENLKFTLASGMLTDLSLESPITIPLTQPLAITDVKNLLVIDPDSYAEQIDKKDTILLLSQKAIGLGIALNDSKPAIIPFDNISTNETLTITKADILPKLDYVNSSFNQFYTRRFYLLPLVIFFGLTLSRLFELLFDTMIISLIINLFGKRFTFKQLLAFTLHLSIPIEAYFVITDLIGINPFLGFSTILFLFSTLILQFGMK